MYSIAIPHHKATLVVAIGILLPFFLFTHYCCNSKKRKKQLIKFAQFSCRKSEQPGLLSECVTYAIILGPTLRKASLLV